MRRRLEEIPRPRRKKPFRRCRRPPWIPDPPGEVKLRRMLCRIVTRARNRRRPAATIRARAGDDSAKGSIRFAPHPGAFVTAAPRRLNTVASVPDFARLAAAAGARSREAAGPASPLRVAAVVVTRNRLPMLRECVARLHAQSRRPDTIYVVDNASDDGTAEWLSSAGDVVAIRQANLGGAGGFHTGLKRAVGDGCDWAWLMDDDCFPEPDALAALLESDCRRRDKVGFLSSLVLWKDGTTHRMNSPVIEHPNQWLHGVARDGSIPITAASFVSLLVRSTAVISEGLPIAEMFVWFDDMEFTMRLSRRHEGWLVLGSRVCHATEANLGAHERPLSRRDPRFACMFRNWGILMRSRGRGLFGTVSETARFLRHNRGRIASLPAAVAATCYFLRGFSRRPRIDHPAPARRVATD